MITLRKSKHLEKPDLYADILYNHLNWTFFLFDFIRPVYFESPKLYSFF